ncbi:MAG: hypothetical protein DMD35_15445 [Gemmatimonadetes bacterium]|nr:MAG: hypothetical protein DMD35_15445 [Gemmatimonadota bacterium]
MRRLSSRAAVGATLAISALAGAQEPSSNPPGVVAPTAATDSLLPFERPVGAPMRTDAVTYRLSLLRDVGPTSLGVRVVEVSEASLGGTPTWLIAERRTGSAVPTTDSLWLAKADLVPLRWVGTNDRTQLGASFAHDSIFGAMQSYAGRASFAAPMLPGALVTPGMTERIVEMLPLRSGYRAAASLLLVDQGTPRALPAEIAVEREERTRTPAGEADCWVVVLRAGAMEERLWVDKGRRAVVRTEQVTSMGRVVGEL